MVIEKIRQERVFSSSSCVILPSSKRHMENMMDITIGMGATMCVGSDRYPFTVMQTEEIKGKMHVVLQADSYKRIDKNGLSEDQDWAYETNPNGRMVVLRQTEKAWEEIIKNPQTGRWKKTKGSAHYYLGQREAYQDPCF